MNEHQRGVEAVAAKIRSTFPGETATKVAEELIAAYIEAGGFDSVHAPVETELPAVKARELPFEEHRRIHDIAAAAYEAATPVDYRYSALALFKAVDAAISALTINDDPGNGGKLVICIGHHTIDQLMAGQTVEIEAAIMIPASDLCQPTAAESRCEELVKALERSMVAINDWLNVYAPDECKDADVAESRARLRENGTLWYIANVQEQNRAALSQYRKRSEADG